jgi:penicillin-binding protein 1A
MVNAYSTVINDGKAHKRPVLVTHILDRDGNEIYRYKPDTQQAISYRSAFLMQKMLMAGMREPGGTSMNLWHYVRNFADCEFGGKTGTSNNHSDAWFVGVCPHLVCGAWVGGEYRAIHFRTGQLGQGSRTALPICGAFYEKVLSNPAFKKYRGKFKEPHDLDINSAMYQCASYYYNPNDSLLNDSIGEIGEHGSEIPSDVNNTEPTNENSGPVEETNAITD